MVAKRHLLTGFFLVLATLISGCQLPQTDSPDTVWTAIAEQTGTPEKAPAQNTAPQPGESQTQLPTSLPVPSPTSSATPPPSPTIAPSETPVTTLRIAVIGDFGAGGKPEEDVANLVKSWDPDYILTTGDNNYPDGAWETIDWNIGNFYHEYIFPYKGSYGEGARENRFFPTLGNHDYYTDDAAPYLDYFTLPGNERYYEVLLGPVHVFALNSDFNEPDGVGRSSKQAEWLRDALSRSTAPWKLVVYHATAYSSGYQGSSDWMRWPFQEWGATASLAGHDHNYERLEINGFPYFTNGLGGGAIYSFQDPIPGSQVRYNADHGGMLILAEQSRITFQFITHGGELVDSYTIEK